MDKEQIEKQYKRWLEQEVNNPEKVAELNALFQEKENFLDSFNGNLTFGTGGLRGIMGAGTNRMNVYTVAKASQGVADYIKKYFKKNDRKVAVSYDSRINSEEFAKAASGVLAANNIQVFISQELMPTPFLSFAVRNLKCTAGIMITASHNPAEYNGYKVYDNSGCQITLIVAEKITDEIEKLDIFEQVQSMDFKSGQTNGIIQYIPPDIYTAYIEQIKKQSMIDAGTTIDKNIKIIYSPLNGTGFKPVLRSLKENGFTNIITVKEQEEADGNFPTCVIPNPEIKEAMELGIRYAEKFDADVFIATDPDCDRVGIAVKKDNGNYTLLSGNETGILLFDYICFRRQEMNKMPQRPIMIKTIVTIDMAEKIAEHYGVETINVLTGFKFIGEQITLLEAKGKADSFIFGFEESCGYLSGTYVRDKDAVNASFLICEMCAYYKVQGISLLDKLKELYQNYGVCINFPHSFDFKGNDAQRKIQVIMDSLRCDQIALGNKRIIGVVDYMNDLDGLPKSNVLKFQLEDSCSIVVRPSGTEPKLKVYISITAPTQQQATELDEVLAKHLSEKIKVILS